MSVGACIDFMRGRKDLELSFIMRLLKTFLYHGLWLLGSCHIHLLAKVYEIGARAIELYVGRWEIIYLFLCPVVDQWPL